MRTKQTITSSAPGRLLPSHRAQRFHRSTPGHLGAACLGVYALALVASCAPAAWGTGPALAPVSERPSPLLADVQQDARDRSLDQVDPLDAALIVSGYDDATSLAKAHTELDAIIERAVSQSGDGSTRERAAGLLQALHAPAGPLDDYDAHATTLRDILEDGSFNCVSSALLYLLAAQRADLSVTAVALPSHVRVLVRDGAKTVAVEPTVAHGFDPSDAVLRQTGQRYQQDADTLILYPDTAGETIDFAALLGIVLTNQALRYNLAGDARSAQLLTERAERFVPPRLIPLLHEQRVSLLNELAVRAMGEKHDEQALSLLLEAASFDTSSKQTKILRENLYNLGGRHLEQLGGDEGAMRAWLARFEPEPPVYDALRPVMLLYLVNARLDAGRLDEAESLIAQIAAIPTQDATLVHNLGIARLNLVGRRAEGDALAAWKIFSALPKPHDDATLLQAYERTGSYAAGQRAYQIAQTGECERAERAVADWRALEPKADGTQALAACHATRAKEFWDAQDFAASAQALRRARALNPDEPAYATNLAMVLFNDAVSKVNAGNCAAARPLIREAMALQPENARARELLASCAGR